MSDKKLTMEILAGPLDGYIVILEEETVWGAKGEGPLSFPWDAELGERQARFFAEEGHWWLESYPARHGTYRNMERVDTSVQLEEGDLVKASAVWMLVHKLE